MLSEKYFSPYIHYQLSYIHILIISVNKIVKIKKKIKSSTIIVRKRMICLSRDKFLLRVRKYYLSEKSTLNDIFKNACKDNHNPQYSRQSGEPGNRLFVCSVRVIIMNKQPAQNAHKNAARICCNLWNENIAQINWSIVSKWYLHDARFYEKIDV